MFVFFLLGLGEGEATGLAARQGEIAMDASRSVAAQVMVVVRNKPEIEDPIK
jgi:hypothetical protein